MAQTYQRVGCLDPHASNYDQTATVACTDCCVYTSIDSPRIIEGCTDRLASNYNSSATVSCKTCCVYTDIQSQPAIKGDGPIRVQPTVPLYPYNINSKSFVCIRDTGFEERGWIENGRYIEGYYLYKEKLTAQWPTRTPNWDYTGSLNDIWAAFDILLTYRPTSRVFINSGGDLVPWIIPLYSKEVPLTVNPNQSALKRDCDLAGGTIYIYDQGLGSGGKSPNGPTTQLEVAMTSYEKAKNELNSYRTYLDSLKRPLTPEEKNTLTQLENTVKESDAQVTSWKGLVKNTGNIANLISADYGSHFMACLCETQEILSAPQCSTRILNFNGETPTTQNIVITKERATCIKSFQDYYVFLQNQYTWQGWAGQQTSFFNTVLFENMGISPSDANFIVINALNTGTAYYPYGQNVTTVPNGRDLVITILKNAFENGANFWLPAPHQTATDIINTEECCNIVGGIFYGGTYTTGGKVNKYTGVCLCNEIKKPCPTLSSGEIFTVTELIETTGGIKQITYVDVPQECCSNEALESRLKGKWTWDGKRCVLEELDNSNACEDATVITINETPINLKDVTCEGNYLTVSAYIYFETPDNICTNGELVTSTTDVLTDEFLGLLQNPPQTTSEISEYVGQTWATDASFNGTPHPTPQPQNTNCCFDTEVPILGQLVIQDQNFSIIQSTAIEYVDTFSSTQTVINTNNNVGQGFNVWVKLTTVIDLTQFNTSIFNIAVEFTQGLYKCCNYDIYFDDIEVGCLQKGIRETYYTEPCVGFDLSSCVIDNKKSWVYNPGTEQMSDSVYDNIVRKHGTRGMNIEQTGVIRAGGHGAINRVFAPSVDAELDFRDTDYFNFHGVIERHSKLVLNSKQLILQFNMCPDNDCILGSYGYLMDEDGNYILDDDGGRIIVQDEVVPFPNLVELERFKKTFQGFWVQIIEQFIPATTIFVAGEKWCNNRICEQKVVADYLLDSRADDLSPAPASQNTTEDPTTQDPNTSSQGSKTIKTSSNDPVETSPLGEKTNTGELTEPGTIVIGNYQIQGINNTEPDLGYNVVKVRGSAV